LPSSNPTTGNSLPAKLFTLNLWTHSSKNRPQKIP